MTLLEDIEYFIRNIIPISAGILIFCWMMLTLICVPYPFNYPVALMPLTMIAIYAIKLDRLKFWVQIDDRDFDKSPQALEEIERERKKTKSVPMYGVSANG